MRTQTQTAYLRTRGREHATLAQYSRVANLCTDWLPVALVGFLVLAAFAPAVEQEQMWPVFQAASSILLPDAEIDIAKLLLVVVITTAAVSSGWMAQSQVRNNGRNAVRYANTLKSLESQEKQGLPAARVAAAAGEEKRDAVRRFMWSIHHIMAAELQEWTVQQKPLDMLPR